MEVGVRLFANLRERLPGDPAEHRGRGSVSLVDGASLQSLLEALEILPHESQMVLVNGERAPRDEPTRREWLLKAGDTVSIFPPLAGG